MLDQISVFVENKTGRLASVMEILNRNTGTQRLSIDSELP